jgi:hypothetical protein
MRAVDCPCGEHFEAANDTAILEEVKKHADEEHPGQYSDADLRLMVNTSGYDAGAA